MIHREARPDFLIIGAMKAGTTTLYRDLEPHPEIFLPQEKEPETLVKFGSDLDAVRKDYSSLYREAREGQIRGDASTIYAKRPDFEGAPEMARALCGNDLKIIYLMRDPVDRMISQYRHEFGLGEIDLPMIDAFETCHRYVDYSRYDWQLEPWQERFADENILGIGFEEYVADRKSTLERICRFLEIDFARLPPPMEDRIFNMSENKPVARGFIGDLVGSRLYQRWLKPFIPRWARETVMRAILPVARDPDVTLDAQQRSRLRARFGDDSAEHASGIRTG